MSGFSQDDENAGLLRCDIMTPPMDGACFRCRRSEEFKANRETHSPYEEEFFRKDGSRWWALLAAKQLERERECGYVIDITQAQARRRNLRESEARFRALAEASPALTWQVDTQGNAVYLNQPFIDRSACRLAALMPTGWRSIIHPDDAPGYVAALEQALQEHSRFQQRVRVKEREGRMALAEILCTAVVQLPRGVCGTRRHVDRYHRCGQCGDSSA